ncbi:MAG: HAMP domain-containing sensor histidine kinase [Polyangiaceae bacterium]
MLETRSPRLREWGLFLLVAALPATALGVLGYRALQNEEAGLKREMSLIAERTARDAGDEVERGIEAVERAQRPEPMPAWLDHVVLAKARLSAPRSAASDEPSEDCKKAADARKKGADEAARRAAEERIVRDCPTLRNSRGRYLWPLLALTPASGVAPARILAWLEEHGARLAAVERAALTQEIATGGFDDTTRAALMQALDTGADELGSHLLVEHRAALTAGVTPILWRNDTSRGALWQREDGSYEGYVLHLGSLQRAVAAGWPPRPADYAAKVVVGSQPVAASGLPLASAQALLGQIHLVVGHPRPQAVAARSKLILASVSLAASLLAVALAALLFSRMRRARALGALRTDFVAAVSHELRTPIASMRVLAELLAEGRAEEDELPEIHAALVAEAKRLGTTVDRLLSFSRMEAGKATTARQRVNVGEVAREAIARFESRHPEAAPVTAEIDEEVVAAADPHGLGMALDNLLLNARKYAPEGMPYEVSVSRLRDRVRVAVRDHGPGIARRDQKRIFAPFERADDRLSAATEGSGIGLSLVRHVAKSHGGDAEVESTPGEGACFVIWLPDSERGT